MMYFDCETSVVSPKQMFKEWLKITKNNDLNFRWIPLVADKKSVLFKDIV